MKTQGISSQGIASRGITSRGITSLISAGLNSGAPQGQSVKGASFDSFMNNRVQSAGRNDNNVAEAVPAAESKPSGKDFVKLTDKPANTVSKENGSGTVSGQQPSEQKVVSEDNGGSSAVEEVRTDEFEAQMVKVLSEIFGMSEEEITDILEQGSMDFGAFLFSIQPDNSVSLINRELIQQFVMDVHGIEDRSVFLTNDMLNSELSQTLHAVTELGAELFGVNPEELQNMEQSLLQSFAEYMAAGEQELQSTKDAGVNMAQVTVSEESIGQENVRQDARPGDSFITVEAYVNPEQTKVQSEAGQTDQNGTQMETFSQDTQPQSERVDHAAAANLFAERLSQAVEGNAGEAVQSPEAVMRQIVEQIVRQVRIRVLPETTRMELQLNPASLGRVSLQVSSSGGVSNAVMVVENQIAKEALESQMITLKESFAEQGLKVNSVEVTVSEFGLKQDQESENGRQENSAGKRSFREDAGTEAMEETFEQTAQTEASRRDSNSVVDYTA